MQDTLLNLGANRIVSADLFIVLKGCGLLCGYLLFDGLTSTTQEYYFGKSRSSSSEGPLALGGAVLDQMIYVNAFAAVISLLVSAVDASTMMADVSLLLKHRALAIDGK